MMSFSLSNCKRAEEKKLILNPNFDRLQKACCRNSFIKATSLHILYAIIVQDTYSARI
jgi:hypothetical protein